MAERVLGRELSSRIKGDASSLPNEWPDHVAEALGAVLPDFAGHDLRDREPPDVPTLVIYGTADRIRPEAVRAWADVLPDVELVELAGVGHFPWAEAPREFYGAIATFLGHRSR